MRNKKSLFVIAFVLLLGIIGGTIAYYQSQDTFTNIFNTSKYVIKTEEKFESPDNWMPGDTTPKEVKVKNEGDVPAAVKVCFKEKWEDENGNELPLYDDYNERSVFINTNENIDRYWKVKCDNTENTTCYYYMLELDPNEETKPLIDSVTFNPDFNVESTNTCTDDPITHQKKCTSTISGYSGGKYTLDVNIETVQADKYKEVWGNLSYFDELENTCSDFELKDSNFYQNMLNDKNYGVEYYSFFGTPISRYSIENLEFVDNMNVPSNAIASYDVSYLEDGSVIAWYTDTDNDDLYEVYIGANGNVFANPNSTYAFSGLEKINSINLNKLDISKVTNMSHMFDGSGEDVSNFDISFISNWDVSKVTNMSYMFKGTGHNATTWNIGNLSNWDTRKVTNMSYMFSGAGLNVSNFDISFISNWDVSNVTNMSHMFSEAGYNATTWNIGNLSNWDTRKVTNMEGIFSYVGHNVSNFDISFISNWDVSNVTNISYMFQGAGYAATTWNIGNLSNLDTRKVTNMSYMFEGAGHNVSNFDISFISNWDVSKVTNMSHMFSGAGSNATTWNIGNLSNWDTSKVKDMSSMFEEAGRNATTWNSIGTLNIYEADISTFFRVCENAKATINLHGNPKPGYSYISTNPYFRAFNSASTKPGSEIIVNYTSDTTNIDNIINTKSSTSNVIKGVQLD